MKAAQISKSGTRFRRYRKDNSRAWAGYRSYFRIKVAACGICHSDSFIKEGHWPNLTYPRIPGHEVAGVIDAVGPGNTEWALGGRVGIGWHGSHCGHCEPCRSGDFTTCSNLSITGFNFDGGYEQYMIASAKGLARIPDALGFSDAAPLLCAGVTTFNSLWHSRALPGDLVAVHGIGGLGHLAIQFARQFGFHVAAISRGKDKEELALRLGAHVYIDAGSTKAADELRKLGGARVVVATAPNSAAISELIPGLGRNGMLLAIAGTGDPMTIAVDRSTACDSRLAFRISQGLGGYAKFLRAHGSAPDDRGIPARGRGAHLSADDYESGTVSGGVGQPLVARSFDPSSGLLICYWLNIICQRRQAHLAGPHESVSGGIAENTLHRERRLQSAGTNRRICSHRKLDDRPRNQHAGPRNQS
jgi:D-arabinose 1-dehydrogenase-like Zn-dependent alcohol dehydrogenase